MAATSEVIKELPAMRVGERGQIIQFDTNFDFTGIGAVKFIIERSDGTTEIRDVDAADYGQGADADLVYGLVLEDDLSITGQYYATVAVHSIDETLLLFSDRLTFQVVAPSATAAAVLAA